MTQPSKTEDETTTTTEAGTAEPAEATRVAKVRRGWFHLTLPGAYVAVLFGCLAFTPSLLPRSGLIQGAVCGISAAIGYGLGVLGAAIWRAFADRQPREPSPGAWRVFTIVAVLALLGSYLLGQRWQGQIRDLMGVAAPGFASTLLWPVIAAVLFALILGLARALKGLYRWISHLLNRWIGPRAARGVGWAAVVLLTYGVTSGVLLSGAVSFANQTFSVRDGITKDGVVQPTDPQRSGGPGSLVPWDKLGREGRSFTGTGPTEADIAGFTGSTAKRPIRAYAGLTAAETAEARAKLAVDDLARAGGFDRAYLMVATTTGSGWLDPASIDTFEYMTGGDSAVVGMQYSYLPSWISYLVDQQKAREAGRELYDAVYDRWSKLPEAKRPKLVVSGESLGSFGGETAFSGEYDLRNRTAGALFAGPPNFNTLYRVFTDDRDEGSKEIAPVYKNGRTVRFETLAGTEVDPVGQPWDGSRVLYVQHSSDPIVWWSPNLLLSRPDWLAEPRGKDVVGTMTWIPFVTFWQVTADLPLATGVPAGHGHKYTAEYVDAWASVLRPPGWTTEKADRLRAIATSAG
ncbi:MAG: alpha/beta hydrolase [Mycobacteriales bacterium]